MCHLLPVSLIVHIMPPPIAGLQSSRLLYVGRLGKGSEKQALQHKGSFQGRQQVRHGQRGQRPRRQCLLQLSVIPAENGGHRCGFLYFIYVHKGVYIFTEIYQFVI